LIVRGWRVATRLLLPPLVIETKKPVALPDRGSGPVDERCRYARDCSQMCDCSDVVIQEQPHRKDVDIVVAVRGLLLKHSREHANPRLRYFSQVHSDWIRDIIVRPPHRRRLREETFDFRESLVRTGRGAQHWSPGRKSPQKPL
jgi:hypothetical protein